jgi:hypothetical protein
MHRKMLNQKAFIRFSFIHNNLIQLSLFISTKVQVEHDYQSLKRSGGKYVELLQPNQYQLY